MRMIEFIKKKKLIYAQIIRSNYKSKTGINFFTNPKLNQQVAYMSHKTGHKITPHYHNNIVRKIKGSSEVLIILSGIIKANFYDNKKYLFKKVILKRGDIIILLNGSHGFEIVKKCKFLEVKQGPFVQSLDKIKF